MVPKISAWGASMAAAMALSPSVAHAQSSSNTTNPCQAVANQQFQAAKNIDIVQSQDLIFATFDAELAYKCVTSVPFHKDEALEMIGYVKEYAQMHTSLQYIKDPPASYQQPAMDVMGRLDQVSEKAQNDEYRNQFEFDLDIEAVVGGVSDGHFAISMGVLGIYQWQLPGKNLVSVSKDGLEIPEVYVLSDVFFNEARASPIIQIEGKNVFTYLQDLANSTSFGASDVHTEWNWIMWNPASQFGTMAGGSGWSYYPSYFERSTQYRGPTLSGRFANGTDFSWDWEAASSWDLTESEFTSGKNIYTNLIVNPSANSNKPTVEARMPTPTKPEELLKRDQALPSLSAVPFQNYPQDPVVTQDGFGISGSISGYILENGVGVLSMPSFATGGNSAPSSTFNNAVGLWMNTAKRANVTKVVIDLSGNGGGTIFAGYNTFKQFFPTIEPSLLQRTRASDSVNTMGGLLTSVLMNEDDSIPENAVQNAAFEWGIMSFVNAWFTVQPDGKTWPSWEDFFGPKKIDGDEFTNNCKLDLASPQIARLLGFNVTGYGDNEADYEQPWAAKDIIMLTDGSCGSTCSIFMELMKTDAGVKSVSIGGIPTYGPMQGMTGTRGSNVQTYSTISNLVEWIQDLLEGAEQEDIPILEMANLTQKDIDALPTTLRQMPWKIRYGAFNALDEIREKDQDGPFPLQMAYEPTDCRLFWTPDMVRNITNLWTAAAEVAGGNMDACVRDSTDGPGLNETLSGDPGFKGEDVWAAVNSTDSPGDDSKKSTSSDGDGSDDDSGALRLTFGLRSFAMLLAAMYIVL